MRKTLCLDFGYTRYKAALFENSHLVHIQTLPNDHPTTLEALLKQYQPHASILSSVVEHQPHTEALLAEATRFHLLSHQTTLNFTTPVGKPASIGADRLALAAAAVHFFPGQHTLVISLGSCVTYNFISYDAQFLGGAISPGMQMRYEAMHRFTAKLPLVPYNEVAMRGNFPVMGYDTVTNLQSGVIAGMSFEMDGFIDYYQQRYTNFNAVLTGGNTAHFAQRLKNRIFADAQLLFKGLYAISEVNNC